MRVALVIGSLSLTFAASQADAASYVAIFNGYVDTDSSSIITDQRNLVEGVKAGDAVTVKYFYNTSKLNDTDPSEGNIAYWFIYEKAVIDIVGRTITLNKNAHYQYASFGSVVSYPNAKDLQYLRVGYNTYPEAGVAHGIIGISFDVYSEDKDLFNGNMDVFRAGHLSKTFKNQAFGFQSSGHFWGSDGSSTFLNIPFKATGLSISAAVPEPSTWALMILGFGAVGCSMRRRTVLRFI